MRQRCIHSISLFRLESTGCTYRQDPLKTVSRILWIRLAFGCCNDDFHSFLQLSHVYKRNLPRQVSGVSSRYSLKPFSYFRRVCAGACLIITKTPSLIANLLSSDVNLICFWGFYAIPIIQTTGKNSKPQSYHSVIFMSWHEPSFRYNDSVLKMRRSKLKQRELSLFCLTARTFLWTLALM